jgi:PIN domain nuclease of toxin-antitoxin system
MMMFPSAECIPARRSLQLLIIDDDPMQRMLVALAAKHAGHAVTLGAVML